MSNALTPQRQPTALALAEDDLLGLLSSSLYPGASHASIKMVLSYCKAAGLDPMQKPVHIVPMWDGKTKQMRDVVMPGVGLYRTQATRNGHAGTSEPEFGPDVTAKIGGQEITYPAWCRVTVKRRQQNGAVDEFAAREFWMENYAIKGGPEKSIAPNAMWTKRPYGQIAKCAEAQALRKAFPEIGAQPAAEEMEGKAIEGEYIDAATGEVHGSPPAPPAPPAAWPDDAFDKQFHRWSRAIEEGLKTVADILALARSKAPLTAEQQAKIEAVKRKPPAEPVNDAPGFGDITDQQGNPV